MSSLLRSEKASLRTTGIVGAALFVLSITLRFIAGIQTPHPTGWDGYYYVMQVHSWIAFGHLQSPDYSLIYPFLTAITFITGDPILGFKIGVALIAGLLTISVYYYLIRRDVALMIVVAACCYIAFSPLVTYFILQFPKNAFGLVFFIFFMTSLKRPGISTAIFFLCTVLTHRMTGAFALVVMAVYSVRYVPWKWIIVGVVIIAALGFLPGILHISDLLRFEGQFTSTPHWAPYEFTKIFPTSLNLLFKADLVLTSFFAVVAALLVIANRESFESWIWFGLVMISLFPFFSFVPGDVGHRFFMIAPIALIVLISITAKPIPFLVSLAVACLFFGLSIFSFRSYKPSSFDAPNKVYLPIVDRLVQRYAPSDYPLVIAHKGLAEIIIYKTDFDALNWLPPENIPPHQVLRITRGISGFDFKRYLPADKQRDVRIIGVGYFAIPEDTWQEFVNAAKKENKQPLMNRIFHGDNPMDQRPYFIGKGKKQ